MNDVRVQHLETNQLTPQKPIGNDPEKLHQGLAKLVLTLVTTVTEVLERQAIRKMEAGKLTSAEVENLGLAFMRIKENTTEIAAKFGLEKDRFALDLSTPGESGKVTLVDVIDKLIAGGTVIAGDVSLGVAGVDLAKLRLMATLTAE